jgi:thioredoxin-related protein
MKNSSFISVFLISFLISISTVLAYENQQKTLLIFSADWCHYCQVAKNDINKNNKLSEVIKNYDIIELDHGVDKDAFTGYNIKVLPTFVIMQNGREIGRSTGYNGYKSLYNFLK